MNRQIVLRTALAGAIALAFAGCASQAPMAPSTVQVFAATLSAAEEVPPAADSKGTGTAEVRLDTKTNEMTWKVSYSGMTGPATAGHIHGPAGKGANAGVVVPFPGVAGAASAEGKGMITPTQYGDLAAGLWYVNVHSAKYPGGELRGQLVRKP